MKKQRVYSTTNHLGQECVVQMQYGSSNSKTGNAVQVWILPKLWVFEGEKAMSDDEASCIDCPHSKLKNRSCYVRKGYAEYGLKSKVKSLNSAFLAGKLEILPIADLPAEHCSKVSGKFIRFGAYGEPVLLGEKAVKMLSSVASNFTGYTHQWHLENYSWAKDYFMASVETEALMKKANSLGFRTFRVRSKQDEITRQEVICPASKEAGRKVTCNVCALCKGAAIGAKNVVIYKH